MDLCRGAQLLHQRVGAEVQIHLAKPAAFGGQRRQCRGGFGIGQLFQFHDARNARIHGARGEVERRFHHHVAAVRVDGIRIGGDLYGSAAGVLLLPRCLNGAVTLDPAPDPERRHQQKRRDRQTLAAQTCAANAHLRIGKGQDQRHDQCQREHGQDCRFHDEDETARIPARVPRRKRAHAVVVRPVQQDMTEQGHQSRGPQQERPHRHLAGAGAAFAPGTPQVIPTIDQADDQHRLQGKRPEGVRPPAVVLKVGDRAA